MFRYLNLIKPGLLSNTLKKQTLSINKYAIVRRNSTYQFSSFFNSTTFLDSNNNTNDINKEEVLLYLQSRLSSKPNLECFNEIIQDLNFLYIKESLDQEQTINLLKESLHYFGLVIKEEINLENEILTQSSEQITTLYKSIIEILNPNIMLITLNLWKKLDPKCTKSFLNFNEFLLTRTKFMNLFEGKQIVNLLQAYYEVRNKLESDKFAYIFDKCDTFICSKKDLVFQKEEVAQLLYLYSKCNLGSDNFYHKLFRNFTEEKDKMSLDDLVTCYWSIVSYNISKKDKKYIVYQQDVHEKILKNIKSLNSFQTKQFLWAYQMEKIIFP